MKKIKNLINKCIGKRGYSWTYHKTGTFFFFDNKWWFYPNDNSFIRGETDALVEWSHKNPLFY